MVRQRTVRAALLYFSVFVFVSIWLMIRNFPERQCDCSKCLRKPQDLASQIKNKRNIQDSVVQSSTEIKAQINTPKVQITTKMPATTKQSKREESNFKIMLADKPGKFKPVTPRHKLGVLVPYRDRLEELLIFVPHMSKFLSKQNITFHIYVINQVDLHRFNRAALLNAGFLFATNESCDYIAMHDVDLLPLNDDLNYGYPSEGPFHVSSPPLHPKYHYAKFIGGIMLMSNEQFRKVNGLSTQFWGWGREDDELYMRIQDAKLRIMQPVGIKTGYKTFMHNHEKKRKRDYPTSRKQYKAGFNRDNKTGLNTMDHKVLSRHEMTIEGYPVSMIAVQLKCKYEVTPWCDN